MSEAGGELTNVPALRFPEFSGTWAVFSLQELSSAEISYGVVKPGERDPEGVAFIRGGDFSEGVIDPSKLRTISTELSDQYRRTKLLGGELVVSLVGYPGACAIVPDELRGANVARQVAVVRPKATTNLPFVYQYLVGPVGQVQLLSKVVGSAQQVINLVDLRKLNIPYSDPAEQQKIADFLGAVDARVGLLRRRWEALKAYKKAMMQRLFARTLRLTRPDGSPFPDWQEKRLGEIGKTIGGLTGKSADDFGDGAPYVTYRQVFGSSLIDVAKCERVRILANERQNRLQRGDALFTTSSETPNEVGFASVVSEEVGELYLNSFCFALRLRSLLDVLPNFAQYLFRSPSYRRIVYPLAQGSTRYNLSKTSFLKLALQLPHPEEQQKIADFLTALDTKIDAIAAQIAAMQRFKQGLLQQMFV